MSEFARIAMFSVHACDIVAIPAGETAVITKLQHMLREQ